MSAESEPFADRLRRLRREVATADAAPTPSQPRELPAWARSAIARRERAASRTSATARDADSAIEASTSASSPSHARSRGLPERLAEARSERGTFAARACELPPDHRHGAWRLDEIFHADSRVLETVAKDAAIADFRAENALFLDIETTGLSGGAGTHVFMIGLGRFRGERFELWQGFLREPSEAPALLAECAARVRESACVVSFFGKTFDRHRLEDQMRLFGITAPFAERPHLDLYHPCRRLYAAALADGRLQTMERALCGVERERDLPGSLAPAAWFDYLAGREHLLEHVFAHNYLDVLSLVTLCAHVGRAAIEQRVDGSSLTGPSHARAEALARLALERRAPIEAIAWLDRAIERSTTPRPLRARRALLRLRLEPPADVTTEIETLIGEYADGISAELSAAFAVACARASDDQSVARWAPRALQLAADHLTGSTRALVERRARAALTRARRRRIDPTLQREVSLDMDLPPISLEP